MNNPFTKRAFPLPKSPQGRAALFGSLGVLGGTYLPVLLGHDEYSMPGSLIGGTLGFLPPLLMQPKRVKDKAKAQRRELENKRENGEKLTPQDLRNLNYLENDPDLNNE